MRLITLFLLVKVGAMISCPLFAQVTADFTANITSGCGSLQVSFLDQSTSVSGSVVSWNWDLGGVNSTNENPGRIFGSPGSYTICLTVTDSEGNSDTECRQNYITVFNLPQPAFEANEQFGCVPTEITFDDLSTSEDGTITQWVWGLGGSTGVVIENNSNSVSSTYENADTYTISLTVSDDNGCVNTITEENYITIFDFPLIDISLSDTFACDPPFIVDITNNNPDPNVEYTWDFGNGTPFFQGTDPPPMVYSNEGDFTVSIIAENGMTNCTDTLILEDIITVGNTLDFSYDIAQGCEDLSVAFSNNTLGMVNPQWDFGDGNIGFGNNVNHVYTDAGCYFVRLSGLVNACPDTLISTECIEVFPMPTVSFSNNNPIGCTVPHTASFFGASDIGTIYNWDFGDGTTSNQQTPVHTFENFGIYPVTLEVTDPNGCTNTITDTIRLIELEAIMNFDVVSGCSPVNFSIDESSISVSPITSWYWAVDTAFSDPNFPLITSTSPSPSFSIIDTGWYDITLVVTNSLGCTDTIVNPGAIGVGIPPQIDFSALPQIACVDEPVQFTDLSSNYGDWWFWEFGDGGISNEQNPSHAFNQPDTFDITLTVAHNGCLNTYMIPDYIIVQEPLAAFEIQQNCINPFNVSFINNSVGADSTFWDFGYDELNTDTSSVLEPTVNYPGTGCYEVTLIVFNFTTNCIDTSRQNFCITDPAASFTVSPLSGCSPLNIEIENNSLFDIAWEWSAPGAVVQGADQPEPNITYPTPGIYSDIQLVITDMNNCQDTIVFEEDILVDGVTVDFNAIPTGGCEPLQVDFIDNSSSFISPIVSWAWDINNGALITTDQNTSFFFSETGTYPVTLTVTNEWGCQTTLEVENAVNVTLPAVLFNTDSITCPADTVDFTNLSEGQGLSYFWNFGDGGSSTEAEPSYQFVNPGLFNVCLTITDFAGCDQTYCQSIEIVVPNAAFTVDSTSANCPPLIVNFENESLNTINYEWNFGDESGISDLENPAHVYTVPGVYDVSLIARLNENCVDTLLIPDLIELEGPLGAFSFDMDTVCIPDVITFFGSSIGEYMYIWDFGDGMVDTTFNTSADTITHIYQEAGKFVPKLSLVNTENCLRTLESPDTIHVGILDIDFSATDSTLCEGIGTTRFINLINSSEPIVDLLWLFEDGNPAMSSAFEPLVSFPNMGVYDVTLMVENTFCRDTISKEDFIGAGALPVAAFDTDFDQGCLPLGVQFTDQSTVSSGSITSWDWAFGGIGGADIPNPFFEYISPGDFEVELVVTTEFNCSDTVSAPITVFEAAQPFLSLSEPEICIGDVIQLGVAFPSDTSGLDFFWLDDPSLSCTDCLEPFANPVETTTYSFVSTTAEGCVDTSSILINVLPYEIPNISLTEDTTICINESIQLVATADGIVVYNWENTDSISCLDCNNPLVNPLLPTMYTLTVTNSFGCDAVDSVLVDVVDQNQDLFSGDRTICRGDSVQLSVLVDGSITWINSDDLSCDDCPDPIAFPLETAIYPVQLFTSDFNCELLDTLTVQVYGPEDIDAGEDTRICIGEQIVLDGFSNSSGDILWTPSITLDDNNVLNPLATPNDSTMYFLTVTDDLCVLEDSVLIDVQFVTNVESFEYEICAGDTVQLSYIGEADDQVWTPVSTLSNPFEASPLAFPNETTEYLLNAGLSTCENDTAVALVIVNQGPEVQGPDSYDKFPGVDVQIEVEVLTGSGDYTFDWLRFDGLSCNNCPDPILSLDTSGFYPLIVYDEFNGCETEKLVFINRLRSCDEDLLFVPNIFTPNDDGNNDKLKIFSGTITDIYTFRIFNRWGGLVFETNDINEGWDGTYKGRKMPSGVYIYLIEAPCPINNLRFLKKGDISLIR